MAPTMQNSHPFEVLGVPDVAELFADLFLISLFREWFTAFWARWNWQRWHLMPPKTARLAAFNPAWSSATMNSVPHRPRFFRLCRKSRQCTSASESFTEPPRTCLRSSSPMPIAVSTAAPRKTPSWRDTDRQNIYNRDAKMPPKMGRYQTSTAFLGPVSSVKRDTRPSSQ